MNDCKKVPVLIVDDRAGKLSVLEAPLVPESQDQAAADAGMKEEHWLFRGCEAGAADY